MKKLFSIRTVSTLLVIALAMTVTTVAARSGDSTSQDASDLAQHDGDEARLEHSRRFTQEADRIEGVWQAQVTRRVCATGEPIGTFLGMTSFIQGGALLGTNSNPNPPTTHGRWKYLGRNRYQAVERFFRLSPDGSFAGVQRITRNITMDRDAVHLTGVNTSEAFDVAGILIGRGCTTDVTTRVE